MLCIRYASLFKAHPSRMLPPLYLSEDRSRIVDSVVASVYWSTPVSLDRLSPVIRLSDIEAGIISTRKYSVSVDQQ